MKPINFLETDKKFFQINMSSFLEDEKYLEMTDF